MESSFLSTGRCNRLALHGSLNGDYGRRFFLYKIAFYASGAYSLPGLHTLSSIRNQTL